MYAHNSKLDKTYLQMHSDNPFFGNSHKVIPISEYETSSEKYKSVVCQGHNEEVIKACGKCSKLACVECDIYGVDCTGAYVTHVDICFSDLCCHLR